VFVCSQVISLPFHFLSKTKQKFKIYADPIINIPLHPSSDDPELTLQRAKLFKSIQIALHSLASETQNHRFPFSPLLICLSLREREKKQNFKPVSPKFPYFGSFRDEKGQTWNLTYTSNKKSRMIFSAEAHQKGENETLNVIVKFCHHYSEKVHQALAQEGLAPKLLCFRELKPFLESDCHGSCSR